MGQTVRTVRKNSFSSSENTVHIADWKREVTVANHVTIRVVGVVSRKCPLPLPGMESGASNPSLCQVCFSSQGEREMGSRNSVTVTQHQRCSARRIRIEALFLKAVKLLAWLAGSILYPCRE
jgi:hypothetical protein